MCFLLAHDAANSAAQPDRAGLAGAAIFFFLIAYGGSESATTVLIMSSIAFFFISLISIGLYLYTPEIYPTRARAIEMTTAGCWSRIASFLGPNVVGALMGAWGLSSVFLGFAAVACIGAAIGGLYLSETRFKVLEELSP